jgi:hypothetical protein
MPNISKKTLLLIGGIVLVIAIIIGLSVKLSKKKTESIKDNSKTEKINLALERAGVIVPKENFQNNTTDKIVFDSSDKIFRNFELFIDTFYPSLNSTEMNNMLKKYGVPKTMQELLLENINLPRIIIYFSNLAEIIMLFAYINGLDYKTGGPIDDAICSSLGGILLVKSYDTYIDGNIYYLNDYKETGDFNIYFTPTSYDISKVTNMKSEIPEILEYYDISQYVKMEYNKSIIIKPYKSNVFNMVRNKIKSQIISNKSSTNTQYMNGTGIITIDNTTYTASDEEIDQILQSFKENRESVIKYIRLFLIKDFIMLHTKQYFTESSQIIKDTIELVSPENKNFNDNIYQYIISDNVLYKFNNDIFGAVSNLPMPSLPPLKI